MESLYRHSGGPRRKKTTMPSEKEGILNTRWHGSFSLLAAIMKITAHMVGLQERMKGPRYDVYGPWPVCPPHIAALYP